MWLVCHLLRLLRPHLLLLIHLVSQRLRLDHVRLRRLS